MKACEISERKNMLKMITIFKTSNHKYVKKNLKS